MAKSPKYTHLFESVTRQRGYQKAACGAMVNSGMGAHIAEAQQLAEFRERNGGWLPPVCPKCAIAALIASTTVEA
jgi:hypothetical protein